MPMTYDEMEQISARLKEAVGSPPLRLSAQGGGLPDPTWFEHPGIVLIHRDDAERLAALLDGLALTPAPHVVGGGANG